MSADPTPADRAALEIAAGHAALFQSIYAGSTNHRTVEAARLLPPEVALAHVHSMLGTPHGPMSGRPH